MMYKTIAILAASLAAAACGGGSSLGGLDAEQAYSFSLTSAAEVPTPKPTTASGSAQILVYPAQIDYEVSVTNMTGITMSHIHSGAPGVAGPIVVTLFQTNNPAGATNGVLTSGSITTANLPSGVTLESLKTLLLSGNSYVNVHTTANPAGEIRGQIR